MGIVERVACRGSVTVAVAPVIELNKPTAPSRKMVSQRHPRVFMFLPPLRAPPYDRESCREDLARTLFGKNINIGWPQTDCEQLPGRVETQRARRTRSPDEGRDCTSKNHVTTEARRRQLGKMKTQQMSGLSRHEPFERPLVKPLRSLRSLRFNSSVWQGSTWGQSLHRFRRFHVGHRGAGREPRRSTDAG